jgi:hypothetical protein
MPGGGTRPREEVRDGPHNNNRCGGNRGGVAPTAAPLRSRAGAFGLRPLYCCWSRWYPPYGATVRFASLGRCVESPVVRPCLPPRRRAQHYVHMCRKATRARRIGFYHGSELPVYLAPALRSAPPRCPKLSPLCGCVRVHQHIIPDDMSAPRWRSWAYRGGAMLNFAVTEFYEVRLPMAKATVQTSKQKTKQKN